MCLSQVRKYKVDLLFFFFFRYFIFSFNMVSYSFTKYFFSLLRWSEECSDFLRAVLFLVTPYENYSLAQTIAESLLFFFLLFMIPFFMRFFYLRYTRLSPNNLPTESAQKMCCQSLRKLVSSWMLSTFPFMLFFFTYVCTYRILMLISILFV